MQPRANYQLYLSHLLPIYILRNAYTPTASVPAMRVQLAEAAAFNMFMDQIDFSGAFLVADIEHELYIRPMPIMRRISKMTLVYDRLPCMYSGEVLGNKYRFTLTCEYDLISRMHYMNNVTI